MSASVCVTRLIAPTSEEFAGFALLSALEMAEAPPKAGYSR
jgi:hypothetical protein